MLEYFKDRRYTGISMVRDKKWFRCRYQKYTEHRNVESISEAELEGIVWKAVEIQLLLLEEKEVIFQREKELCEEKRKKLLPEIKGKKMQAEKKREEMETELAALEAEEKGLRQKMEEIDADSVSIVEWMGCKEDKKKLLQSLIRSVDVYGNNRINITWRFQNKVEI